MKLLVLAIDYSFIRIIARVSCYTEFKVEYIPFFSQGYQSNRSLNIPRAFPWHLTSFAAREGGNLINLVFPRAEHLITTHRGWGI